MTISIGWRHLRNIGFAFAIACICPGVALAQKDDKDLRTDKGAKPTFGAVSLEDGFQPTPFRKNLVAGGGVKTTKGGNTAWVARDPDFILDYKAGKSLLSTSSSSTSHPSSMI